jgi:uncharacterized protein YajQ (UPF0234 family)
MAQDSSFDIVSKPDLQEVDNALNQVLKEIATRFDFKGSTATLEFDKAKKEIALSAESENRLKSIYDMIQGKMIKRGVSLKSLKPEEPKQAGGMVVKQVIKIQDGIPQDKAKELVQIVKEGKFKVTVSIQADQVRVSAKNKDDLQAVIAKLRTVDLDIDLSFTNYR